MQSLSRPYKYVEIARNIQKLCSKTLKKVVVQQIFCIKFTLFFVIILGCLFVFLNQKLTKKIIVKFSLFNQPPLGLVELNHTTHTKNYNQTIHTNHSKLSEYRFFAEDLNAEITLGNYFKFKLITFDANGSPKTLGGDFIYALMQDLNRKLSTHGHVEDNNNGSYTVTFYAAWSGRAEISMTLVYPSLAVEWLKNVFWPSEKKLAWIAKFRKKVTKNRENKYEYVNSNCTIVRDRNFSGNNCIYDHPSGLGKTVIFCRKPPEYPCENLFEVQRNFSYIKAIFYSLITNKTAKLFKSPYFMENIDGWPSTIFIKEKGAKEVSPSLGASRCGPNIDIPGPGPLISGYWRGESWTSFACNSSQHWDTSMAYSCLKTKEVYLLGDSTTKQWFDFIVNWLHLKRTVHNGWTHATGKDSVSLFFNFHAWTLHRRRFVDFRYEEDIIDSIPRDHCNCVIVVSLWAHFCLWPVESYMERLTLIRESLVRLLLDCPKTLVVIKGSHPTDHSFLESNIHSSDWLFNDMNRMMREVFQGINAIFLDMWNINLAFPIRTVTHMPKAVISQEVALFLSYICP